jgi:chemotaxis protein methyltransferase CheR
VENVTEAEHAEREFDLGDEEFRTLQAIVYENTGIALADHKIEMVYNRLARRLRQLGLRSFAAYLDRLRGPDGEAEMGILINAITTNLTRFFRESHHMDHLGEVVIPDTLTRIQRGAQSRMRVWSAGCSSGEEPYTIAMVLAEGGAFGNGLDTRVLATDLDTNMLQTGADGVYDIEGLDGIPAALRKRYVVERDADGESKAQMRDTLRERITFKHLNLMADWPMKGSFDAIFCRNVMIYFDRETRTWLVNRFLDYLRPGGWLYTGHAESMVVNQHSLCVDGRTIYRKVA